MRLCSLYLVKVLLVCLLICHTVADDESQADEKLLKNTNSAKVSRVSDSLPKKPSRTKRNFDIDSFKKYGKWIASEIPYTFEPGLGADRKKAFLDAVKVVESKTCIRFHHGRTSRSKQYVYVMKGRKFYCKVDLGKLRAEDNRIVFGKRCDFNYEAIHMLLHILGMHEEQNRPDRDKFVKMDFGRAVWLSPEEKKLFPGDLVGEPYDYRSVMHHWYNYDNKYVYEPIIMKLMPGGPMIGQWQQKLSLGDVRKLNKFYKCNIPLKSLPIRKKDKVEIMSANCNFDRGMCNWKNWKNGDGDDEDQFDWKFATEAKKYNGPHNDHSDGKRHGKFLYFIQPAKKREEIMSSGVLASPFVNGSNCLVFMYCLGNMGHLRVFIREADSKEKNPYKLLTERHGKHDRNKWWPVRVFIPAKSKPYQIYIEGLKTPDQTGAVSVDDVFVFPGLKCYDCPANQMTGGGKCCKFPFQYQQKSYSRCIKTPGKEFDGLYWCGITSNFDRDRSGRKCSDSNDCYKNPCASGSTCVDLYFDYKCVCPKFTSGKHCEVVDDCYKRGLVCPAHSTCQLQANKSYKCICDDGFLQGGSGVNSTCEDIDECSTQGATCSADRCNNTIGSYTCTPCPEGSYEYKRTCVDFDECNDKNPCKGAGELCINTDGSYDCDSCKAGYLKTEDGCIKEPQSGRNIKADSVQSLYAISHISVLVTGLVGHLVFTA